jgi:hypothetical protein
MFAPAFTLDLAGNAVLANLTCPHIVCCPSPYLGDPTSTRGFGDTFTAGAMLADVGPKQSAVLANLSGVLVLSGAVASPGGSSSGLAAANQMRS